MAQNQSDQPKLRIDFEGLIAKGEMRGSGGFQAQTANGTARWRGAGWNKDGRGGWDGNSNFWGYDSPELTPDATRRAGRSNRTGE